MKIIIIPISVLIIFYVSLFAISFGHDRIKDNISRSFQADPIQDFYKYNTGTTVMWNDCEAVTVLLNIQRSVSGLVVPRSGGHCTDLQEIARNPDQERTPFVSRIAYAEQIYYGTVLQFFTMQDSMHLVRYALIFFLLSFSLFVCLKLDYSYFFIIFLAMYPIEGMAYLYWGSATFALPLLVTLYAAGRILQKNDRHYDAIFAATGSFISLVSFPFCVSFSAAFMMIITLLKDGAGSSLTDIARLIVRYSFMWFGAFIITILLRNILTGAFDNSMNLVTYLFDDVGGQNHYNTGETFIEELATIYARVKWGYMIVVSLASLLCLSMSKHPLPDRNTILGMAAVSFIPVVYFVLRANWAAWHTESTIGLYPALLSITIVLPVFIRRLLIAPFKRKLSSR